MYRTLTSFRLAAFFAVILMVTTGLVYAEGTDANRAATSNAIVADLLIARPLGLVAAVLGTGIWIVGLPFTLINGSTEQAAKKLIVEPAEYTFTRPLGKGI